MTDAIYAALDLLVRSGLLAGAALGLSTLAGRRPAEEQVAILRAGVCLLLVLPVVMALGPAVSLPLLPPDSPSPSAAPAEIWAGEVRPVAGVAVQAAILQPSPLTAAVWVWGAGVIAIVGRFLVGVWTLHRWTRASRPATAPAWLGALRRLGGAGAPRLLVSPAAPSPLSWGLPPGIVLIDPACHARPEAAAAVLAHELAHLRRRDWLFLALSRLALALFWFNPLVWRLHSELATRSEEAADAAALAEVEPAAYARTLVSLAAGGAPPAALAMAGTAPTLARRIARIMKARPTSPPRPLVAALTVVALVAVATPIAAIELAPRPPAPPEAPIAPPAPPPPAPVAFAPPAPPAPPAPMTVRAPEAPRPPLAPRAASQVSEAERREARAHAAEARAHAAAAREAARTHAAEARAHGQAAAAAGERARAEAEVHAAAAHRAAARAMAEARVEMARGAEQMMEGARTMRAEGQRLRDPAYRAEQIERARRRGDRVPTDAELLELSRDLPQKAEELEEQARRLREEAADIG